MNDKEFPPAERSGPVGLMRLIHELALAVPLPATRSEVIAGARRTRIAEGITFEHYPPIYAPKKRQDPLTRLRANCRAIAPNVLWRRSRPRPISTPWIPGDSSGCKTRSS